MIEDFRREFTYVTSVVRTFWRLRRFKPHGSHIFVDVVEGFAATTPDAPAIITPERVVTYQALDDGANRFAHWAMDQGVRSGEVVALMLDNCPEYLMAWIGLLKLGAVVALVNINLKGPSLAHSITIAKPKLAIVGDDLFANLMEAAPDPMPKVWTLGGGSSHDLDKALAAASFAAVDRNLRQGIKAQDTAFYIYTSGTTGLPKAARFSHSRMLFMMCGFGGALKTGPRDRTYVTLPLYHATGGICAVGMALLAGGALILKRKFSAHDFWDDCRHYHATYFAYIGELCRYLYNAPPDSRDGEHVLKAATGNGLRPELWPVFQKRFHIPRIVEFYGATEGNVAMLNYDNVVGAVGRLPRYMRRIFPTRLVRYDIAEEAPIRGLDGFCIECKPGEAGEAIGAISERAGRSFEGYTTSADTQKKVLCDVFRKGDVWFRTGDLLRRDKNGYFYFVDRIGDTFRWKGENVATSEVSKALGIVPEVEEVNVYGVTVPGCDGRAGMAALVVRPGFAAETLAEKIDLPPFARPLFLRLRPRLEITGTFKLKKADLVKEGFDPNVIDDPLYWYDPAAGRYEPLTHDVHADIISGRIKI